MKMTRTQIKKYTCVCRKSIGSQIIRLFTILFFCISTSIFSTISTASAQSTKSLESNQAWHDWNYYQLLGLLPEDYYQSKTSNSKKRKETEAWSIKSRRERTKERSQIQSKDIKKAYRKQAQAWHPDKIASRKNQQANATKSNGVDYSNLSVEECNARFAKIAEAYGILNDEQKRRDYDVFLLDGEDQLERENKQRASSGGQGDSSTSRSSTASSFFQEFFTDPLSTFEEFFFGSTDTRNFMEDIFDSFYGGSQRNQQRDEHHKRKPDRTSETTQVRYDPRFGKDVLQVLQKEEFDEPKKNRIYFRVIAQEFIEEFAFGRSLGYSPISEPHIVEEGHLPYNGRGNRAGSSSEKKQQHRQQEKQKRRRPLALTSHRLEKYEYITPQSIHLHSANGEYYAGLTLECELVIMHDEGPFEEDTQFWGSDTFASPKHRDGCALAVYGDIIAIVVGDVEKPTAILWTSPTPPPIVHGSPFDGEEIIDFYCSLDDDGSLALYRTRESQRISVTGRDILGIAEMWWSDFVAGDSATPPKTQAAATWKSIQRWAVLKRTGKPSARAGRRSQEMVGHIDECVFATGPAGCLTPGRHFVTISKTIKRSVGKAVSQLDDTVGGFMDSLWDEDDIDLFDTVVRIITKCGKRISSSGFRTFKQTIPKVTDFISQVRYKCTKWVGLLQYEAMDYAHNSKYKLRKLTTMVRKQVRVWADHLMNLWES